MLYIIISVSDQSFIDHIGCLIPNGTVCRLHDRLCRLLHHVQGLHGRLSFQYVLNKMVQLPKTDPAWHTLSAGLCMAQFQKSAGHIYRT